MLEAIQRLNTVITSLHIAALVEDENRCIILTNTAFIDLFEIERAPQDLVGHSLEELGPDLSRRFGDPTRDPGRDRLDQILRRKQRVIGDRIALTDGRVLERDFVPIYVDHEYRGQLWLFRDVSSQAESEAEWEQLLAAQRDENSRLVELANVKSAFLAEISHELRTPLTSILSFTELLRDGVGKDDPLEQAEFLEVISRNADRLLRLVDDLLLLDKAETGALAVEWGSCDIPALVSAAVATFMPAANAKQIVLEAEIAEGPLIAGDAQRLAQLFDVLLSNAVKFTPEKGRVLVTTTAVDEHWLIAVADSGIGVPPAERSSLFERFYRASNARAARIPGSGLGLSVARAIATLHGGEIVVTGGALGGAVALASLPLLFRLPDPAHAADATGRIRPPMRS